MNDDICGAETRDGTPCQHPPGWGTGHVGEGRCKHHGGASSGAPAGEANGNADHLGFSDALGDVVDAESTDDAAIIEAFEDAADTDNLDPVWMRLAGEGFVRYRRSGDARHLAECRRCLENAGEDSDVNVGLRDLFDTS